MPISAHLLRKLQDTLGMDAAADLTTIVETVEATRADLAELRHEFDLLKARVDELPTKADLKDAFWVQTRWMLGGLVVVLLAILFKS